MCERRHMAATQNPSREDNLCVVWKFYVIRQPFETVVDLQGDFVTQLSFLSPVRRP